MFLLGNYLLLGPPEVCPSSPPSQMTNLTAVRG
jgi:hypothetical protein